MDNFLRLGLYTLKKAKPEKGSCENTDSFSPWRDRLKGEVVEVHRVMFFNSTLLHLLFSKCERKLSSTYHVSDLESITSEGNTTG